MNQIVQIKIEDCCRVGQYLAQNLRLKPGEKCVIQTDRGVEMGTVINVALPDPTVNPEEQFSKVIRKAGPKDMGQYQRKRSREVQARETCLQLIEKHNLAMKLTRVEYVFDGSKVIFYYTSDGRVDFRALVKDLASTLKTRIEMRQIGVRDEAKLIGGVGCCGLPLCCSSWLRRFQPVSIRMAKQQCLNLNPARLSGVCGRLMCCLMYETEEQVELDASGDIEMEVITEESEMI